MIKELLLGQATNLSLRTRRQARARARSAPSSARFHRFSCHEKANRFSTRGWRRHGPFAVVIVVVSSPLRSLCADVARLESVSCRRREAVSRQNHHEPPPPPPPLCRCQQHPCRGLAWMAEPCGYPIGASAEGPAGSPCWPCLAPRSNSTSCDAIRPPANHSARSIAVCHTRHSLQSAACPSTRARLLVAMLGRRALRGAGRAFLKSRGPSGMAPIHAAGRRDEEHDMAMSVAWMHARPHSLR